MAKQAVYLINFYSRGGAGHMERGEVLGFTLTLAGAKKAVETDMKHEVDPKEYDGDRSLMKWYKLHGLDRYAPPIAKCGEKLPAYEIVKVDEL